MKIAIGCDHGGFPLKNDIISLLKSKHIAYKDFGVNSSESVSYVPIAKEVSGAVASGECGRGILLCGTGVGMSIAANKMRGIRAACCSDHFSAKYTRLHNDANILCLGARVIGGGVAAELTEIFLDTEFEGGRHTERVGQIMQIEEEIDFRDKHLCPLDNPF